MSKLSKTVQAVLAFLCMSSVGSSLALDLQAHRGGRGLRPENTLAAFDHAMDLGVSTLELDVGITADGELVVSHDPYLNPAFARDAQGRWLPAKGPLIRQLTLAELQGFDVGRLDPSQAYARSFAQQQACDGQRVPRLAALFERVRTREAAATAAPGQPPGLAPASAPALAPAAGLRFNIETKLSPGAPQDTASPQEFVTRLLVLIRAHGMLERVTLQSFDWRTLQLAQQQAPGLRTAYLSTPSPGIDTARNPAWTAGFSIDAHGGSLPRMVKAAGGHIWSPSLSGLSADAVHEAQALGLQVIPWTVNAPADMQRLLDWGVDGLITDYPDRLRSLLLARGQPLPPPLPRPRPDPSAADCPAPAAAPAPTPSPASATSP